MIFAGTPPTIVFDGTSFVTTAFAQIKVLSPTITFPKTFAPGPKDTWSPITGFSSSQVKLLFEVYSNFQQILHLPSNHHQQDGKG